MNLRIVLLMSSLILMPALYGQELPNKPEKPNEWIAQWRSPALFFLGISAAHIGIIGSIFQPAQTKGVRFIRTLAALAKFTLGVTLITSSDRIVEYIDYYKKRYPIAVSTDENDPFDHRRVI